MNNSGSADAAARVQRPRPPLLLIVIMGLALVAAVVVGVTVLPVLYGVIAPPMPPVPLNATENSRTTQAYGVDVTVYDSADDPCALIQFYIDSGYQCRLAPLQCGALRETIPGFERVLVGECSGEQAFSIFDMEWNARIYRFQSTDMAQVEMAREVFWIGTGRR